MNYYTSSHDELAVALGLAPNAKKSVLAQVKIYNATKPQHNCSILHNHLTIDTEILDVSFLIKKSFLVTLTHDSKRHQQVNIFKVGRQDKLISYLNLPEGEIAQKIVLGDKHSVFFAVVGRRVCKIMSFNSQDGILELARDVLQNTHFEGEIADAVWLIDPPQLVIATTANKLYKIKTFDGAYEVDQVV